MFDLFDINKDGHVDGLDFLLMDTILFPPEEEHKQIFIDDTAGDGEEPESKDK